MILFKNYFSEIIVWIVIFMSGVGIGAAITNLINEYKPKEKKDE